MNNAMLDGLMIIVLSLMFIGFKRKTSDIFMTDQRAFLCLLIANIFILFFDSATWALDGNTNAVAIVINKIFTVFYYAMNPVIGALYVFYINVKLKLPPKHVRIKLFFIAVIIIVNLVISIVSAFYPLYYGFSDGVYVRGVLFPLSIALSYSFVAYSVIELAVFYKKKEFMRNDKLTFLWLSVFPVIPLIGGITQIFLSEYSIVWIATGLSIVMLFINIQNTQIVTDSLTRLYNRRQLMPYLYWKYRKDDRTDTLAIILIDIDDFKAINDTYGHIKGDEIIVDMAGLISKSCENSDFVARYGGDEYIIVAERENEEKILELQREIDKNLDAYNLEKSEENGFRVGMSIGYAKWEADFDSIDKFITVADENMYKVKDGRKSKRITFDVPTE